MREDISLEDVNKALIQISPESLLTGFLSSAPCLPDAAARYRVPGLTSLSFLIKEQVQAAEPLSLSGDLRRFVSHAVAPAADRQLLTLSHFCTALISH